MHDQTLGEVARVSISPKTLKTTKSKSVRILEWMHNHPEDCQKTTYRKLSQTMLIPNCGLTPKSIEQALHNLSHQGIIFYKGKQRARTKDIFINYLHPKVPKYMVDEAPTEEIRRIQKFKEAKIDNEKPNDLLPKPISEPRHIEVKSAETPKGFSITLNINLNLGKD